MTTKITAREESGRVKAPDAEEDRQQPPDATRQKDSETVCQMQRSWLVATQQQKVTDGPSQVERHGQRERPVNQGPVEFLAEEKPGERDQQNPTQTNLKDRETQVGQHSSNQEKYTQSQANPDQWTIACMQQHAMKFESNQHHKQ